MNYLERIAITGFNAAACDAGIIPEIIPIKLDMNRPDIMFPDVKIKSREPKLMKLMR